MLQEKETLLKAFEGIDQGNLSSFCGVEVNINENGITLSMKYYWKKIMKRFGISNTLKDDKPIKTKIKRTDCPVKVNDERKKSYLQIIGSIIFGYTHCRLDLAYAVGMFTRVMHNPSEGHLKQLYGLLNYINATASWGLNFYRDQTMRYGMDFIFFAHCDSSHADDEESYRSTSWAKDKQVLVRNQDKLQTSHYRVLKLKQFGRAVHLHKEHSSANFYKN